ncbi:MAG: hypothetical protein D6746_13900, partial [Bacteroidetes bacterium]
MPRALSLLLVALALLPVPATAQFVDTFADGDFTMNPSWVGETDRWQVVPFGSDFALQTNGVAASDTLHLATASTQAFGQWRFTFRYEGGALSNFNLIRVFLLADTPDLEGNVRGYHLQIGTNNRDVRVYRSDPGISGGRTLLAQSDADVIAGDARTVSVHVTRTPEGMWTVTLDDAPVLAFTETGPLLTESTHFGLWVKHSSTRGQGYFFDDFDVNPEVVDTVPPRVAALVYDEGLPGFLVTFTEDIDFATVGTGDVTITGDPVILSIVPTSGNEVTGGFSVQLRDPLPSGDYDVTLRDIADLAGNVLADTTITVTVVADETPPVLLGAEAVSSTEVHVTFDEPVALDANAFQISDGITVTGLLNVIVPEFPYDDVVMLAVDPPLTPNFEYTLTVQNLTDAAGNVLVQAQTTFILFQEIVPARGEVVVNEIMYDPPAGGSEYVELFNCSDRTFDLSTFTLADNRLAPVPVTDEPTLLPPGGYAVLVDDATAFEAAFPGVAFVEVAAFPALNNSGDAVVLLASEAVIDSVAYLPAWGGAKAALERRDPAGPSSHPVNWGTSTDPRGGTPGARNTLFAPDTTPPAPVFADQPGPRVVDVFFDEPLDPATVQPTDFAVGTASPVDVTLLDGDTRTRLTFGTDVTGTSVMVRGVADPTGNTLAEASVTLARLPGPGDVVINEIMYDPLADPNDGLPDQPEYVELFNRSGDLISLRGAYWSDVPDENGEADTTRFAEGPAALPPGGYAVVFAQPDALTGDDLYVRSTLVLAFPADYRDLGATLLPVRATSLGLTNSGDLIRLHRPDDVILDEVFYEPAWHDAARAETDGVALERIDPAGPSGAATNWTSSRAPEGGTPGRSNSVAPVEARLPGPGDVVINEIMYEPLADPNDGRPDQPEYVELFNRSGEPLALNGLFLTDRPDENGEADTLRIAFAPIVLPPGGYAVVYNVPSGTPDPARVEVLTAPFPTLDPDAPDLVLLPLRRSLGLDNGGDLVRLHAPDGLALDEVAYDPAWHHPNLRSTRGTALERIDPDAPA